MMFSIQVEGKHITDAVAGEMKEVSSFPILVKPHLNGQDHARPGAGREKGKAPECHVGVGLSVS